MADRIEDYHALGIDELIVSGDFLEEAYRVGEGLIRAARGPWSARGHVGAGLVALHRNLSFS